jgi:nicotinate-nucleotide adenylyltransferase
MRIGVFGGTFDPPHIGHLILAEEACYQMNLDRILWLLTPNPPHKPDQVLAPLMQRLRMVALTIRGNSNFELSRVDIDRPPPHYALDTMRLLLGAAPGNKWFFLEGEDSLRDLPDWHQPQALVDLVDGFGVMRRPGVFFDSISMEKQITGLSKKLFWLDTPLIEISSSDIRERILRGAPYQYFLSPAVHELIAENHLYFPSITPS